MAAWQHGSMEACKHGSMEAWMQGSMEAKKHGSKKAWKDMETCHNFHLTLETRHNFPLPHPVDRLHLSALTNYHIHSKASYV